MVDEIRPIIEGKSIEKDKVFRKFNMKGVEFKLPHPPMSGDDRDE